MNLRRAVIVVCAAMFCIAAQSQEVRKDGGSKGGGDRVPATAVKKADAKAKSKATRVKRDGGKKEGGDRRPAGAKRDDGGPKGGGDQR